MCKHCCAILLGICLVVCVLVALSYLPTVCDAQLQSYIAGGGWLVTALLASLAAVLLSKELGLREWCRIREREASEEQADAKRTIALLIPAPRQKWRECPNRYLYAFTKWICLACEDKKKLDKARRRLSHFWVDVVELVRRKILTPDEVWRAVGDPELIYVLEALEVLNAVRIQGAQFPKTSWPWEAVKALGWWLEEEKKDKKAAKVWKSGRIPVELKKYRKCFPCVDEDSIDAGTA